MAGTNLDELKEELFQNLRYRLGDGIVDLEIDPEHCEAAYKYAMKVYTGILHIADYGEEQK